MKLRKYYLGFFVSLWFMGLKAQDTLPLSIPQSVEYAMSHNLTLRNARLDMDIADKKVLETLASGLPQIDGSLNLQHTISEIPTIDFDGQKVTLGVKNNVVGNGQLGQLIFSGSYIVGLQASKVYKSLSRVSAEQSEIDIRQNVIQGYYTVLLAMQQTEILRENLSLTESTLKEVRKMYEQGLVEKTSVKQIEVSRNLLETEYLSASRQCNLTLRLLKYTMGMPLETPVRLTDHLDSSLASIPAEYLSDPEYDPKEHVSFRAMEVQTRLAKLQLKLEQAAYLPSIQGSLTYQYNFTLPEFSFVTPQTWMAGATLSIPLFSSGLRKSRVSQMKIALEKAKNNQDLALQGLILEFEQSHDAFITSYERYNIQKENMAIAKEVLDNYHRKYILGVSSSTELTQANNDYLTVVSSFLSTEIELLNKKVSLDKVLSKL